MEKELIEGIEIGGWGGSAIGQAQRDAFIAGMIRKMRQPGAANFNFLFTGDCLVVIHRDESGEIEVWDTYVRRHGTEES